MRIDSFNSTDKGRLSSSKGSLLARLLLIVMTNILYFCASAVWLQMYIMRHCPRLTDHLLRLAMKFCPAVIHISVATMVKKYPGDVHLLIDPVVQRLYRSDNPIPGLMFSMCEHMADPRIIKTHLCFSLLPNNILEKSKVIYVMRNPKDMLVSYYHHCRLIKLHSYTGTFEEFVQTFLDGDMMYGSYHVNLKEAFARQYNPNLLIVQYEDMKAAPMEEMMRINSFLGTDLSDEQMVKIVEYTSFSEMKKRDNFAGPSDVVQDGGMFDSAIAKAEGGFFRKGEAGAWKELLTPELSARLDSWVSEKFTPYGIGFRFTG